MPIDTIPVRVRMLPAMLSLVVVLVLWLGFCGALAAVATLALFHATGGSELAFIGVIPILVAWLVSGAYLLLHVALNPWRYTFGRNDLHVRGWLRRTAFPWAEARSARLVSSPFGVALMLTFEGGQARVPLLDYYGSSRLLSDIERRLPVAVSAPQRLKDQLERSDRSVSA